MSDMLDWAKREVAIASKRERGDKPEDEWDYGVACYDSALKAFESLLGDNHSGFSIHVTKGILNRLIDGKPLTPIEDPNTESVYNFGLYSFDKGNPLIGYDLFTEMERLVSLYHRVEWRMIGGNPVKKHYDRFCKKHGGNVVRLHDVCKDPLGHYVDEYIYEIVKEDKADGGDR